MYVCMYIYIYIYIYINSKTNFILQRFRSHFGVYTCIYIHIEREREREREALVIALFRVHYDQFFPNFPYFFYLFHQLSGE